MREQFMDYLHSKGYSEYTPSGHKSTVYTYAMCIERILEWENMSWDNLKKSIDRVVCLYDIGGKKEEIGKKSHSSYIAALKAFQKFVS